MNKKLLNTCLMLLLLLAVTCVSLVSYAYLTQLEKIENNFQIDEVRGTITVTGANDVDTQIKNNELAYIDYINDFILNKHGLLDDMSSEIKIKIESQNNFPTRIKVKLPRLTDASMTGLLFIIIPEDVANISKTIQLQLSTSKVLQYGYLENNQVTTWNDLTTLNLSTFDAQTTSIDFRTAVDNYNYNLLKGLYEDDNKVIQAKTSNTQCYRILMWGDYLNFTDPNDKLNYLTKQYNFNVNIKVIQDIKHYGGTLDYEND